MNTALRTDLRLAARAHRLRRPSIVVVGLGPNATAGAFRFDSPLVLTGGTGRHLAALAGLTWRDYLCQTTRLNVFQQHVSTLHPTSQMLQGGAERVAERFADGDTVLLLGQQAARAFGLGWAEWMNWTYYRYLGPAYDKSRAVRLAALPHTSGRARFYDDRRNRRAVEEFLRGVFQEAPGGESNG